MKRKQIITYFLTLFNLLATVAHSETPLTPLNLNDVIETVTTDHPLYQAQAKEIEIAKARAKIAAGAFDPKLNAVSRSYIDGFYSGAASELKFEVPSTLWGTTVFAGYRHSSGTFPVYEEEYITNEDGENFIGLNIPLLRDGATDERRTNIFTTATGIKIAELWLKAQSLQIATDATTAYWSWIGSAKKFKVYSDLLKVAKTRAKQLEARVKFGDLDQFTVDDNSRAVLQRESSLILTEQKYINDELKLQFFLNAPLDSSTDLLFKQSLKKQIPKDIPNPSLLLAHSASDYIKQALKRRPDFLLLDEEIKILNQELKLAKNQLLPRLDAKMLVADDHGAGKESRDDLEVKGALSVEVPLRMRKQYGKLYETEEKLNKQKLKLNVLERKIANQITQLYNSLKILQHNITIAKAELDTARKLEDGERERFSYGDSNLIFVNLREQTTAAAAVNLIDSLANYHITEAEFNSALGLLPNHTTAPLSH